MSSVPILSVFMVTYNHENYIRQAVESALMQKTNFPFEIIIGEDCSTDRTREIVLDYESRYPDKVRVIRSDKNVGASANAIRTLGNCKRKYVAFLEGDDYWTSPDKLQKQVDFLEANPDHSICFHRVYELEEGKQPVLSRLNTEEAPQHYTVENLAKQDVMMHTLSVVFRNHYADGLPEWFGQSPVGDYTLHMLNASHGKIYYLPEPMGVYRKFVGMWGTQSLLNKQVNWYKTLGTLVRYFDKPGNEVILQGLRRQQAASLVFLYEHDAREVLMLHEPLVKEVLDLYTVTTPIGMVRYSTGLLFAGLLKKMLLVMRHNPVVNRLTKRRR